MNAVGKTTVLESIFLLVSGKSFRSRTLSDIVQKGQDGFKIFAEFEKNSVSHTLEYTYYKGEKSIRFNGNLTPSPMGVFLGVLLTPDDQHLIKGSPHSRRDFIDLTLCETDPLYGWNLNRYERALKQRNALLKIKELRSIEGWEYEMAKSAAYITSSRHKLIDSFKPLLIEKYKEVGEGGEQVSLKFNVSKEANDPEFYKKEWSRLRHKESIYGHTLIGPHKDDLILTLNDEEAKHFASEGQKQTLLVALKLAEWEWIRQAAQEAPLFMIDDFGLGMDRNRKERLIKLISNMSQVIITSVDYVSNETDAISM